MTDRSRSTANLLSRLPVIVGVICLLAAIGLGLRFFVHKERVVTLAAEVAILEEHASNIALEAQKAEQAKPDHLAVFAHKNHVLDERNAPKWSPALRSVAASTFPEIAVQDIRAREVKNELGACEMRIDGTATGPDPRLIADRFRLGLNANLTEAFAQSAVQTRFLRLEDVEEEGAVMVQPQASFVIIATVGPKDRPLPVSEDLEK